MHPWHVVISLILLAMSLSFRNISSCLKSLSYCPCVVKIKSKSASTKIPAKYPINFFFFLFIYLHHVEHAFRQNIFRLYYIRLEDSVAIFGCLGVCGWCYMVINAKVNSRKKKGKKRGKKRKNEKFSKKKNWKKITICVCVCVCGC